ncbi:hypothetical protein FQR65_LT10948 [Abscondita terminalis]|nr:hypothetical protein FQR65_LT10948 [Abscondita terminalis]
MSDRYKAWKERKDQEKGFRGGGQFGRNRRDGGEGNRYGGGGGNRYGGGSKMWKEVAFATEKTRCGIIIDYITLPESLRVKSLAKGATTLSEYPSATKKSSINAKSPVNTSIRLGPWPALFKHRT